MSGRERHHRFENLAQKIINYQISLFALKILIRKADWTDLEFPAVTQNLQNGKLLQKNPHYMNLARNEMNLHH